MKNRFLSSAILLITTLRYFAYGAGSVVKAPSLNTRKRFVTARDQYGLNAPRTFRYLSDFSLSALEDIVIPVYVIFKKSFSDNYILQVFSVLYFNYAKTEKNSFRFLGSFCYGIRQYATILISYKPNYTSFYRRKDHFSFPNTVSGLSSIYIIPECTVVRHANTNTRGFMIPVYSILK